MKEEVASRIEDVTDLQTEIKSIRQSKQNADSWKRIVLEEVVFVYVDMVTCIQS